MARVKNMKVRAEQCDNMPCGKINVFDVGEKRPYAWIELKAHFCGSGGSPLLTEDDDEFPYGKPPTLYFCSTTCMMDELDRRVSS